MKKKYFLKSFYLPIFLLILLISGCTKDDKKSEVTLNQVEELGKKYGFEFKQATFEKNEKPFNIKDLEELETVLKRLDKYRNKKSTNNLKLVPNSDPLPATWLQEDGSYAVEPGMNGGASSVYVDRTLIPGYSAIRNTIVMSFNGTSISSISSNINGFNLTGNFSQTNWYSSSFGTNTVRYFNVSIEGYLNLGISFGSFSGYFHSAPYNYEYQIKRELKFNKYIFSVRPLY